MNPGERLTMNFAGGATDDDVAAMGISLFNFNSASASAPDELTITVHKVGGGTFTLYITNQDLDASGRYTIKSTDGTAIEKLVSKPVARVRSSWASSRSLRCATTPRLI